MYTIGSIGMSANPRHLCHVHQMFLYAVALMEKVLTDQEKQIVLLHCGLGPTKSVVGFSQLARLFSLKDSAAAREVYQKAVIKTRRAIPGSAFENWSVAYAQAYCLSQRTALQIDPAAPVPDWDDEKTGVL